MFKNKKFLRIFFKIILIGFAIIGFVFSGVFVAMKLHITDVKGSVDSRNQFFDNVRDESKRVSLLENKKSEWMNSSEFKTFEEGVVKDNDLISEVSVRTGVSSRLIVSVIMPEQLRFFTSNREAFKRAFEPLKILGTYTQFSYGISGVKMDTAKKIEENLKDTNSPFYLGKEFENILDYNDSNDIDSQRLGRFTDSHDHYYSYLYTALYIKEIMREWEVSGYPINNRPEVVATLFNLGFDKSIPKDNPEVGGSSITINGVDYTFGGLAYDFYYSGELSEIFPFDVQ